MRVAVTGGTGYVGAHIVRQLLTEGHEVKLLVAPNERERIEGLLAALSELGTISTLVGDVRSDDVISTLLTDCEAVVHGAGIVGTDDSQAKLMWEINADASERVLTQAVSAGLDPVVLVSSYAVLFPSPDPIITLDSPVADARSAYARSKAHAEQTARRLQAEGAPVVITYPSSVVGPAFNTAAGVTEQGWGTITSLGYAPRLQGGMAMIDVRDIAEAHAAIVSGGSGKGPRRYLCGGELLEFDAMIDALERGSGSKIRRIPLSPSMFRFLGRLVDTIGKVVPMSAGFGREAAELLTAATPTDDSVTLGDLNLKWRSPADAIASCGTAAPTGSSPAS
ncbi:SDR family NAD(P)-dependent oxidoreductase [Aldersonia kunmingensis]|uniref:SDR family NAD(P)-dependent oxidoreductase n=1 Tax=Aldersonia kunmingensis TaxID=408066 RepID=UPI000834ADA6|nr:SDR family NAD(P)-dependent oxidoreductase [Aldersonia kunmingensis]